MMKRDQPKKQKKQKHQSIDQKQQQTNQSTPAKSSSDDLELNESIVQAKHDQKRTAKETTNLLNFFQDKQINILQLANSFGLNVDKQTDSTVDSSSSPINSRMGKKKNQSKQQQPTPSPPPQQPQQSIEEQLSSTMATDEDCSFLDLYLEAAKLKSNENEKIKILINDKQQQQQCKQNLVAIEADTEDEEDEELDEDFYLEDESLDNEEIDDSQWEVDASSSAASIKNLQNRQIASNVLTKNSMNQNNGDSYVAEIKRIINNNKIVSEKKVISEDNLLLLASSSGYYELAQFLLSSKSDIKQRGLKELTHSLLEASACGHADIVQLLLQYNAKVDARTRQGNTSLIYAASHGHTNVVRVLIKHVQDRYKQDNKNISPEQFIEIYNDNGHTALMECVSANHLECAKVLLYEYNASVICQSNEYKESCLTLSCYKGHYDMVKFLLELNSHHYSTEELTNALLETSLDGHTKIARLLIDKGARVNMPEDSHFESCLNLAACGNHIELACLLLSKGANIEEINDEGYTPLQSSVREKHEEMVALLLSKNAKINYVTKETQETALGLACASNYFEIADFLIRVGANLELGGQTPLQISCQEGHIDLVKHLIECGAEVNARSLTTGDTALHYAVDYPEIVRLLILANADIEAENDLGLTCLQKAIQAGRLNTIQVLVEYGANIKELETTTANVSATATKSSNKKSAKSAKSNSQNRNRISSSIKDIDPVHQKIHEQHMMLVNGENQQPQQQQQISNSLKSTTITTFATDDSQPILCDKHASEFVESSNNTKRKLSQPASDEADLLQAQAFEQLTNYFQQQRDELNTLTIASGNSKKKTRLKQQQPSTGSNCSPQTDENICNELLGYEFLSNKKLKSAMKNQPDRCIKLIDELMCKLNSENRLTPENELNQSSPQVSSLPNALKETERLEQCINHMMRRTELLNPSKEEQIKQKQQILEELQRVEKELQEKAQAQLLLSHQTHQKEKFLKSLCAQTQQHKQQLVSIENQTNSPNNTLDNPETDAKLDSISFSLRKGLSKLISFNKDTTNCLLDNATNSATDHPPDPSECAADSNTLLSNMECFEKQLSDEELLESLKKCEQQQETTSDSGDAKSSDSMNKKLRSLLKTNCNLKDDLNKVLSSLSSDCSNQSNNYQMVTLPKIAEEIKKMQTHLSNQREQLDQFSTQPSDDSPDGQYSDVRQPVHLHDNPQVQDEDEQETNTTTTTNTDDELSALFGPFEDNQIKLFKQLSEKLNIDNPLLAKILYEIPSTSDCSEQENQAIIIEETEEEDLDDCLDEEQSDDENLTDQDEFFVEEDQLTGDHHIVHERRVLNLKQYPNIEEMFRDNQHKQLFSSSEDEDDEESKSDRLPHQLKPDEKYLCNRSTQTIFSSSPKGGVFQLLKRPVNNMMSYLKKVPIIKSSNQIETTNASTQTNVVGKCMSVSESFVRKKSVNISSRDHVTCDHHSSNENLATIETLCNLNTGSINNLCNESSKSNTKNFSKSSTSSLSKEDAESRKLFDQIMKFNKLKSENPENKDIKKMINQWVLEVSKNSHLLTKLERITSYPKEIISEMVQVAKKDSGSQQTISSAIENLKNGDTSTSATMNETSLLLVENENKSNSKMSNKQSTKLSKKLIKSTLKKDLKGSTKIINNSSCTGSNNELNKSSIKIQSATINNPHTNASNPQLLRNHVRNIMKAKRTLNQTTITEEHHTQLTISSRSKDNCSKIDLKLLEDAPEEYNQFLNQINYNYSCYNSDDSSNKNQGKKGSINNTCKNDNNSNIKSNVTNSGNKTIHTTTTTNIATSTTTTTTTTTTTGNKNTQNKTNKNSCTNKQSNNDSEGKSHDTALTLACAHGHFELVKLLIGRGAKIDHRDSKGFTPLHWAAMHARLEIIDFLVNNNTTNNKVDLEAEDKLSMTPLLVAALYGHLQVVQKLIGYGSSVNKVDKRGQSILHCASKNAHVDIVKYLLNNCLAAFNNLDIQDSRKLQTPLHLATINSNYEIVNKLLECGASIKIRDKTERTVIHWAATKGNSELLDRFLQDKDNIEINARDSEGKTALLLASEFGHKKCAQLLLKSGSDIFQTDNDGKSALHLAVMSNHHSIVQILVQKGAPLNLMNGVSADLRCIHELVENPNKSLSNPEQSQRQQAPLHIACEMGFTESAQILLSHGADFTIMEKTTGKTPLLIAAFGGHVEIGRLLVCKCNADMNAQLVQVNPKNSENIGFTALAVCAEKGYFEFVDLLINNKANLEIKTKKGCSPLWLSCSFGHLEVVQLLVKGGADVDSQDNRKITCIMAAFRSGHIRVVKWLVRYITQFPSDNEMIRYMSISNEEEKKRCKTCMDIINEEKSKQAAQANDIANTLLEELDLERMEEEAKKMGKKLAASKKRERKKQKRKEKEKEDDPKVDSEKSDKKKFKDKQSNKTKSIEIDDEREQEQEPPLKVLLLPEIVASAINKDSSKDKKPSKTQKSAASNNQAKQQPNNKDEKKELSKVSVSEIVSSNKKGEKNKTNEKLTKKPVGKLSDEFKSVTVEKCSTTDTKHLDLPSNVDYSQLSAASISFTAVEKVKTQSSTPVTIKQQQKEDDWKEVVRRQKKITVPANAISRVIERGGCNIKLVREVSGAHIDIENQKNPGDNVQKIVQGDRQIIIKGSNEATKNAYQLIQSLVNEPEKDINQILNQLGLSKPITVTLNESQIKTQSNVNLSKLSTASISTSTTNTSTCAKQSTNAIGSQTGNKTLTLSSKDYAQKHTQIVESTLQKSNNSSNNSSRKSSTTYHHSVTEHHDEPIDSSSHRSSIWNNDKSKESLSRSNNRVELIVSTSNESPTAIHQSSATTAQPPKEIGYFSPFDSILGKVAQETIWQSTKEPMKPNFASVAAAGLTQSNSGGSSNPSMSNYLTNSDSSLNKSFKKAKETPIDTSKGPGYRSTNISVLSPNHIPSSSNSVNIYQQQLTSTSSSNNSNVLNQIMINNFGPIRAKSAPCTPPLSSSGQINKPPQFQPARKDHFSNASNSNVQKLLISPTKGFTASGNHNFVSQSLLFSTSSPPAYHQSKSYSTSTMSNRNAFPSTHDSTTASGNLLQSTGSDLPTSTEPMFGGSSIQMNHPANYPAVQQSQVPIQSNLQNTTATTSQTPIAQPLASNLQIQMRAALLAAGAQLQQCMQTQIPNQQNKSQHLQQFFQQAAQLQAATRFQQLNNLNQQTDLANQQSNENKLRLLQQMQQYNMSYLRSGSQTNQTSIQQQPQQQQQQQQFVQQPQTSSSRLATNMTTLSNPIQKITQPPTQTPSLNTLNLNPKIPVAAFSPNANKFNMQPSSQMNPLAGLSNQFSATTQSALQINPQVLSQHLFTSASKQASTNEQSQFAENLLATEDKCLPRPIGTERAQRVKLQPETQTFNDLSSSFNQWPSNEQADWSASSSSAPLNSPGLNQFNSPNALLNYENSLFNGLKNPLLPETESYWTNLNSSSTESSSTSNNANLSKLTTLTKMSSWQSDWNSPKK